MGTSRHRIRAIEDPRIQKCMSVRMIPFTSRPTRRAISRKASGPAPVITSSTAQRLGVRIRHISACEAKAESWPALGAPQNAPASRSCTCSFRSDPNCHRSHCHSFARATSAQKSACNLSSDENSYGRSRLPTCRWSPLPASLSYRTTQLPRMTTRQPALEKIGAHSLAMDDPIATQSARRRPLPRENRRSSSNSVARML